MAWRQVVVNRQEKGEGYWVRQKYPYEMNRDGVVRRKSPGPSTHVGKALKTYHSKSDFEPYVTLSYQGEAEHWMVRDLLQEVWGEGDASHIGSLETKEVEPLDLDRPKGEDHWNSRLTVADVHEIRRIYRTTRKRHGLLRKLAEEFGISRNWVWLVCNGRGWRHLKERDS